MAADAAVFVKSVPVGGRFLRIEGHGLTRQGVPHGLDPINEVAVEWAVRTREAGGIQRVVAVSMGPASADDALHRALAMGCDDALRITDPALSGADVGTTAYTLAAAVRHLSTEIALFGSESLDGSSGAVPAAVAALLGRPLLSLARTASIRDGRVQCERDLGEGLEVVESELPVVLSFVAGGVEPRYPKLKDVLAARKASMRQADLRALDARLPSERARERVVRLEEVSERAVSSRHLDEQAGIGEVLRLVQELGAGHA